ncbi:MAG: hypothetical protein ACRDIC_16990 [bacterium]
MGGNIDFAKIAGIKLWNPNLDWAYQSYGPLPPGALPPLQNSATTLQGQVFAWNMRGWFARLNLTFSERTTAWILYETGTVLCSVPACGPGSTTASYNELWLRVLHTIAPQTVLGFNYQKANTSPAIAGTPTGDYIDHFLLELFYAW